MKKTIRTCLSSPILSCSNDPSVSRGQENTGRTTIIQLLLHGRLLNLTTLSGNSLKFSPMISTLLKCTKSYHNALYHTELNLIELYPTEVYLRSNFNANLGEGLTSRFFFYGISPLVQFSLRVAISVSLSVYLFVPSTEFVFV